MTAPDDEVPDQVRQCREAQQIRGFDAGEHPIIVPEVFDVMTSWYSCPHCCESIVDERQVKEKLSDEVDRAAERFLNGVENYLEEDKSK